MTTTELADLVGVLVNGWTERIEHFERCVDHTNACRGLQRAATRGQILHWGCLCPVVLLGRETAVRHPGLLESLAAESSGYAPSTSNAMSGGRPGKPKSKPPATLDAVDLLGRLDSYLAALEVVGSTRTERLYDLLRIESCSPGEVWVRMVTDDVRGYVYAARILLGYES